MKQKGITCVGIIFNTDYHYESGSHWVCVYIDISKNIFFFFDNTGDEPQKEITIIYDMLKEQNSKLKYKDTNKMKHQYNNTECGVYCLYVISNLLEKKNNNIKLQKKRISDEKIEKYRYYFNKPLNNIEK